MLLHEATTDQEPERRAEAALLSERRSIAPSAPTADWDRWEAEEGRTWPLPRGIAEATFEFRPDQIEERRLVRSLVERALEEPAAFDPMAFRDLDHRYVELGWSAHRRCLHHQAHDWLHQQRQVTLWQLKRDPRDRHG